MGGGIRNKGGWGREEEVRREKRGNEEGSKGGV